MSNPKALAAKEKGNAAFKAGDYPLAIGHYTSAIMADARDPTYPLNRAAAYLKLGKNEDAERDCNTVLGLNAKNVKALFRRGQARVGTGKLLEAQKDFSAVLAAEPANASAQEELKKVDTLIQNEKLKKAKVPLTAGAAAPSPDSMTAPKARRVPIRIIDPAGSQSTSTPPLPAAATASNGPGTSAPAPASLPVSTGPAPAVASASTGPATATLDSKAAPTPRSAMLEPVSSRSLKQPPAPTPASVPPALAAAASALKSELDGTDKGKGKPAPANTDSFQQAKQARDSAKPSRVGGGIFRSSGNNTIFATRGEAASATKSKIEEVQEVPEAHVEETALPPPAREVLGTVEGNGAPLKAPATLFDFSKAWNMLRSPEEKWALLNTIPAANMPALCQTSLEPALLVSMLDVFRIVLAARADDAGVKAAVRAYMENLARIPRFGTLVLFLSRPEKELARSVFAAFGVDRPTGPWQAVG